MRSALKQNEQLLIFNEKPSSSTKTDFFRVASGSRMLVTLSVTRIDPGASISLDVADSVTAGDDLYQSMEPGLSVDTTGQFKRVYSDFNHQIQIKYVVTNGTADFKVLVALFDNASTTRIENAQLSVNLDAKSDSLGHYDSIRIGDGTDELDINPDGSLPTTTDLGEDETPINVYSESPSVASGAETAILTYVIPTGKIAFLYRADCSGENIARYQVRLNGNVIATRRTYFGGGLNTSFEFMTPNKRGLVLEAGDVLEIRVIHYRPDLADFEARSQLLLKDAA